MIGLISHVWLQCVAAGLLILLVLFVVGLALIWLGYLDHDNHGSSYRSRP